MEKIIQKLNREQKEVVTNKLSNIMVVAGAGTGKTTVLVSRIVYLNKEKKIPLSNILAVTFTNKASMEMKERINSYIDKDAYKLLWVSTFHSLCFRILKNFSTYANLKPNFQIIDTSDQLKIIKDVLLSLNLDNDDKKEYLNAISDCKENFLRPGNDLSKYSYLYKFSDVYSLYQKICTEKNVVDFSELLLRTYELLINNIDVKKYLNDKFKEILVDEFQDTNIIQYELLKLLSSNNNHVMIVGDDDQSIYGWRGARLENMHRFRVDFSNVNEFSLVQNYRSTNYILRNANSLICNNSNRVMEKNLVSLRDSSQKVLVVSTYNDNEEADFAANIVKKLSCDQEYKLSDIAILYRTNMQSRCVEKKLTEYGFSYKIFGGQRFYDREEVKDFLAYVRLILDQNDDVSFERIVNVPSRKIGKVTLSKIKQIALECGISLFSALSIFSKQNKKNENIAKFVTLIDTYSKRIKDLESIRDFAQGLLEDTNILEYYENKDKKDCSYEKGKVDNLKEIINELSMIDENSNVDDIDNTNNTASYQRLQYFIDSVALRTDSIDQENNTDNNYINLMTIHSSKGLEFKCVILIGFEEGLLPHNMGGTNNIEEERRLSYVAITRAKDFLVISYCNNRYNYSIGNYRCERSRFIRELDSDSVLRRVYKM